VNRRSLCLFMLMCLLMAFVQTGSAQEIQSREPAWMRQMYAKGWQKVQEGVLRRDAGDGRLETFGYGAEGYQWLIEKYSRQITYFEGKYREAPSAELASLIDRLQDKVNALQDEVPSVPAVKSFDIGKTAGCTLSFDYTADAGPLSPMQGVTATASAYVHSTCPETGSTFAYAYAHAGGVDVLNTAVQEDPEDNGEWVNSYATAKIAGSTECESRAQASVDIPSRGIFRLAEDENYECPDMVSITGPSQALTDYYGPACADVTWTAHTASGRTDYTFEWYIGTGLAGTGPTLARRYCSTSESVTVTAVATDSAGHTATSASFTTDIQYRPAIVAQITGPVTVSTNLSTPCANVTWTASAGGGSGHSGYTYKWYLGTGTTVQGTGSTFTKSYCSTTATVPVKLVATASDGHSADATFTTKINHSSVPLSAWISGPFLVNVRSGCQTITWTSTVSGGSPSYSYSWTIGTLGGSTAVVSTASSLTRTVCTPDLLFVRLNVQDSASQTTAATSFTLVLKL
jgi:hypothetical protein